MGGAACKPLGGATRKGGVAGRNPPLTAALTATWSGHPRSGQVQFRGIYAGVDGQWAVVRQSRRAGPDGGQAITGQWSLAVSGVFILAGARASRLGEVSSE